MTITNMYNLIAKANGYGTLYMGGGEYVPVYINDIDCISHGRCQNEIRLNCSVLNSAEGCKKPRSSLGIKNVIFNDPATIVFWTDGTKTVVKAYADDFDPEKGLAMAIAKKFLGNQGNYYNEFHKWLPKEEKNVELDYPEVSFVTRAPDLIAIRNEIDNQYDAALKRMFGDILNRKEKHRGI